jgi:hypothetical protein
MLMQEEGRKREGVVHVKNLKNWTLTFRFCTTTSGLCSSRLLLEAEGNARQRKKLEAERNVRQQQTQYHMIWSRKSL